MNLRVPAHYGDTQVAETCAAKSTNINVCNRLVRLKVVHLDWARFSTASRTTVQKELALSHCLHAAAALRFPNASMVRIAQMFGSVQNLIATVIVDL